MIGRMATILTPSGDTTGATDTAEIGAAVAPTGSKTVLLTGNWYTRAPIVMGQGAELAGEGAAVNGVTSMNPKGTVIHPVAAFTGGEVITLPNGTRGHRLRDFTIINDLGTGPNVDGIAAHGEVDGGMFELLAITKVTGHGLAWTQLNGMDADGVWIDRCMIQRPGLNGLHRIPNDANVRNVHVQYAGQAGDTTYRHAFYSTPSSTGNATFEGCRADLCVGSGWLLDHKGVYGDAIKLVGCSTERNAQSGVLIINSSPGGDDWRTPVIISGCGFGGDGTGTGPDGAHYGQGGDYAGIEVRGRNRVFISGTCVTVNNVDNPYGAPRWALIIRKDGSPGANVETIVWEGGRMNFAMAQGGSQPVLNHSLCDNLLIGPTVTYTGDYRDITPTCRAGKVTLNSSGQATVTTKWSWPNVLPLLTPLASPAGRLYVSSRSDGSFTIKSTAGSSDSGRAVAWMIAPGD